MTIVILDLLGSDVEYDYILCTWAVDSICYVALGFRNEVLFNV